jgi:hypothetical protein
MSEFALLCSPAASAELRLQVCLVLLAVALPFLEGAEPFLALRNLGWPILLANGILAFALNVSAVVLIGASGSIVQTLSGILKVGTVKPRLCTPHADWQGHRPDRSVSPDTGIERTRATGVWYALARLRACPCDDEIG